MIFTSLPKSFSSFQSPLIYTFESEQQAQDIEFKIINASTSQIIATRRLYGVTSGEIDIAPYLRRFAQVSLPESVDCSSLVDCGAQMRIKVEALGVTSPTRYFVASKTTPSTHFQMLSSQIAQRTMARDEFDIVTFYSSPDAVVEVVVESYGKSYGYLTLDVAIGGVSSVCILPSDFEASDTISVSISVDGELRQQIEYEIKSNLRGARRVGWLNEHLVPELYTFPMRKSILVESTRRHIETSMGKEAAAIEHRGELKLLSAYEPQEQLEALASIIYSPKIWVVRGVEPQRVELRAERSIVVPCDGLGIMELDICAVGEDEEL